MLNSVLGIIGVCVAGISAVIFYCVVFAAVFLCIYYALWFAWSVACLIVACLRGGPV